MSEHQKETAFLRHCLRYGDSAEHRVLDDKITQIQRDERCVRRAVWLMAVLTALAVAGLGYAAVLVENFLQDTSQMIGKTIFVVGLASVICLVVFLFLRLIYRMRLDQRREECRQLVMRLLDARLGHPATTTRRDHRVGDGNAGPVPVAAGGNGSRRKTESIATS